MFQDLFDRSQYYNLFSQPGLAYLDRFLLQRSPYLCLKRMKRELRSGSDIDILVKFDKNHILGSFDIIRVEIELIRGLCPEVDLRTPEDSTAILEMRL